MSNDYEPKVDGEGNKNPKYVDLLEEDKPIANQKWTCVSFVSPEKILKSKELFYFEKFLKEWELSKTVEKYRQFMNFVSYKYNVSFDSLSTDLNEFVKEERDILKNSNIEDDFKTFVDNSEEALQSAFDKEHGFKTSVRSVKIRGVYPTQEEAELRCKMLREVDPYHDVYVGPVGMWMPWEPEAYKTGRVDYLNPELNKLMSEKNKNTESVDIEFQKRVREAKEKAISENIKIAEKTGNKLTQNIDSEGNLFSVTSGENSEVSTADIRKELFENDNVINRNDKSNDKVVTNLISNQENEKVNNRADPDVGTEDGITFTI